jgi:hypothetical protein
MRWQQTMLVCAMAAMVGGAVRAATLLHYDFSDGNGTTVTDLSGNGNHGTLIDFSNTGAGAGAFGVSEGWVTGGGISFLDAGSGSYVSTPLAQGLVNGGGGSFTVEFTASADGPSGWTSAIGAEMGGNHMFFLGLDGFWNPPDATYMWFRLGPSDNNTRDGPWVTQPWVLPGNQSDPTNHHIALTFVKNQEANGGVFEVYIDGASRGVSTNADNLWSAIGNFIVGVARPSDASRWDGIIYGVAISDRALSPDAFVLLAKPKAPAGTVVLLR